MKKLIFELLLLATENITYQKPQDEYSTPKITGIIKNETGKKAIDIKVTATLLDARWKFNRSC